MAGRIGYWAGKKRPPFSSEWLERMSLAATGNKNALGNENVGMLGKHHSEYTKEKMRLSAASRPPVSEETREKRSGAGNGCWQGGKSFEPYSLDWSERLKEQIRERDGRICQICSVSENGKRHDVHHIDYDKKNCSHENLITLCIACNTKANYHRSYWPAFFQWLKGQKESEELAV